MELRNSSVQASEEETDLKDTKWAFFVKRSTTTRIQVILLEEGRSVIKSIEIDSQGLLPIGKGLNKP